MSAIKKTLFFISSGDGIIGLDIETELNFAPESKIVMDTLRDVLGIEVIHSLIDYAKRKGLIVKIAISSEDVVEHSLSFDPFSAMEDSEYDSAFVLFVEMLGTCIEEYNVILKEANEEEGVS